MSFDYTKFFNASIYSFYVLGTYCEVCSITCDTQLQLENHLQSPRHNANLERKNNMQSFQAPQEMISGRPDGRDYDFNGLKGFCYVCNIELTSKSHAEQHINGRPHAKKKQQTEILKGIAQVGPGLQYPNDELRVPHVPASNSSMVFPDTQQNLGSTASYTPPTQSHSQSKGLYCEVCDAPFTGIESQTAHFAGEKHRKKVRQLEMERSGRAYSLFCEACNVSFTGQECAESHYNGSKHKRNIKNLEIKQTCSHDRKENTGVVSPSSMQYFNQPTEQKWNGQVDLAKNQRKFSSQNVFSGREDQQPKLFQNSVNPYESNDDIIVKPLDSPQPRPELPSLHEGAIGQNPSIGGDFQQIAGSLSPILRRQESVDSDETKVKCDLLSTVDSEYGSPLNSLEDCLSIASSRLTEPFRIVKNDFDTGVSVVGRGRGFLQKLLNNNESLPGGNLKTEGRFSDSCNQDETVKESLNVGAYSAMLPSSSVLPGFHSQVGNPSMTSTFRSDFSTSSSNDRFVSDIRRTMEQARIPESWLHGQQQESTLFTVDTASHSDPRFVMSGQPTGISSTPNQSTCSTNQAFIRPCRDPPPEQIYQHSSSLSPQPQILQPCLSSPNGTNIGNQGQQTNVSPARSSNNDLGYNFDTRTGQGYCYVCAIELTSPQHFQQHTTGKKHLKAMVVHEQMNASSRMASNPLFCHVCNVSFTGPESRQQHMQSERHLKKEAGSVAEQKEYFCDICKVPCSGPDSYRQHLEGSKHKKLAGLNCTELAQPLDEIDRTIWHVCQVCNAKTNSAKHLQIHMDAKHPTAPKVTSKQEAFKQPLFETSVKLQANNPLSPINQNNAFVPNNSNGNTTPLESFLSEPLFPAEYLPTDVKESVTRQEVEVTGPFQVPERYAETSPRIGNGTSDTSNSGKRGQGSDLAFATRNQTGNNTGLKEKNLLSQQLSSAVMGAKPKDVNSAVAIHNPYAGRYNFYCHTCKRPMDTQQQYEQHIAGSRHQQKVCTEPAPTRQHLPPQELPAQYVPYSGSQPRNYQLELYQKAMASDALVFLPTGTPHRLSQPTV